MPKAEGKANVTAVVPIKLKEKLKKYADTKKWSLSTAMVSLIEEGLDREGPEPDSVNDKPAQTQPTSFKELVRQKYFEIMNSGKISPQRLKDLSFGQKPSSKERVILAEVLGVDTLPED